VAVAFIQEFDIVDGDTSTTNYDRVAGLIGDEAIDGLICHSAGFDHDGGVFRIFDVWENGDAAKSFYEGKLMPIIEGMMADNPGATPPQREATYELHDVIR
jgi:hypothetical protein